MQRVVRAARDTAIAVGCVAAVLTPFAVVNEVFFG
jgi:hypothetical protein